MKTNDFIASFNLGKVIELENQMNTEDVNEETVNGFVETMVEIFTEAAVSCGFRKEVVQRSRRKNNRIENPWFDKYCAEARRNHLRIKKRFSNFGEGRQKIKDSA